MTAASANGVPRALAALTLAAGLALAQPSAANAAKGTVWLCKPGLGANPCLGSLETTAHARDGSTRVRSPRLARRPKADCFYVYPTVSQQATPSSNRDVEAEQTAIARWQAQRFSRHCRVFAPVYRQRTLIALATGVGDAERAMAIAYEDVLAAWREYLAEHNRGRSFVLIGHSQGTRMLRLLARNEIDRRPAVRKRLVSALMIGGNVTVRAGRDAGGDFRHIPACRARRQTGCVVAYSAFHDPPPADSRYGRSSASDPASPASLPGGPGYEVLCTSPAGLGGGTGRLRTLLPSGGFPGILGLGFTLMLGEPLPREATPWILPADRYRARCVDSDGAHVLRVEPIGAARRMRPFPDPTWGLHLADVNLALGNLVALVGRQLREHRSGARAPG